ncbi:MAG: hypothetical protein ACMXYB_02745 [Candidatus Woesearchaeota archaeon]
MTLPNIYNVVFICSFNMVIYFGVKKIIEYADRINITPQEQPPQIGDDVLVAIMSNGIWAIAPNLTCRTHYDSYYSSYIQNEWESMLLYRVPKDMIKHCPDEGRVGVRELEQILKNNSSM